MGAKPAFTDKDILLTFLCLRDPCSRAYLVHAVGVGEGSMRSILDILKQKGLLSSTKQGHELTARGKHLFAGITRIIHPPVRVHAKYYASLAQYAVVVRAASAGKGAVEARDEAIRNGARAALVLIKEGALNAQGVEEDFSDIDEQIEPENGDVVAIAFADDDAIAKRAALGAAMVLSSDLGGLMGELAQ